MRGRNSIALAPRIDAEHADLAAVGAPVALEDLDGGGLARAVRPEQAEDLADRDRERDPVDGRRGAVALLERGDLDRRRRRVHRCGSLATPTRTGGVDGGASVASAGWPNSSRRRGSPSSTPPRAAPPISCVDAPLVVEQVVDDGAGVTVRYQVRIGPAGASVSGDTGAACRRGAGHRPRHGLGHARGRGCGPRMRSRGARSKVRGRPELLAGRAELFARLDRAFAPVRAGTTLSNDAR